MVATLWWNGVKFTSVSKAILTETDIRLLCQIYLVMVLIVTVILSEGSYLLFENEVALAELFVALRHVLSSLDKIHNTAGE